MALVEYLLETRTPLELAKELAQTAKENADLQRRIVALEVQIFWLNVKLEKEDNAITE